MSDVIRKTPYVSPDTMRAKLHMDQKLENAHTSKTTYYHHSNDTHNVSTMENWGAEMLLETRKLKMNRPPLGDIHLNGAFSEFFEMRYDDNINMYEQENAIMCLLKENALQDGKQLYITFSNVTQMIIPRAASDSEKLVFPHIVWKTTTPPVLHISGSGQATISDLVAYSDDDKLGKVTYWFCTTSTAAFDNRNYWPNNNQKFYERNLLDEENCHDDIIQTLPIDIWGEGLPLVWLTFEKFNTLPSVSLQNNIGYHGYPILTFGTDGNGHHYLYPYVWGDENFPEEKDPENSDWFIRLHSRYPFIIPKDDEERKQNEDVYITNVEFVHCINNNPYLPENYLDSVIIPLPTKNARFKFVTDESLKWGFQNWIFRKPQEGEWDYDGTSYVNKVYAQFNQSFCTIHEIGRNYRAWMQPMLEVIPNTNQVPIEYVWERDSIESGVHIDYTTDYSLNHVMKKHGTIFNLGDFDGLPPYYYYKLPRTTHRAHVELYHVKDVPNGPVNHAMDKRVATILVDAAIPQTDVIDINTDMESAIVYHIGKLREYHTIKENILSSLNVKSDIGFSSRELFGDTTLEKYKNTKPFIYHGNRTFSLGILGYDPELEYGRVYYLSNDTIEYDNNAITPLKKPERTMARICDIPTDTSQLVSIKGKAPTLVLDEEYHRTELNYSIERDFHRLWMRDQLVTDGKRIFFQEDDIIYNRSSIYQSRFDYVWLSVRNIIGLPEDLKFGINIDLIQDDMCEKLYKTEMIDLYENRTLVCKIACTMERYTNKITYLSIESWYTDISEKSIWHCNNILLSASQGAGRLDQFIPNFKISIYLLDDLDTETWEDLGVDFERNPLDYELTYQWLNEHYGTPRGLNYQASHKLSVLPGIHTNYFNEAEYIWRITKHGTGYVAGDEIQCYFAGRIFKGVVDTTTTSGAVSTISLPNPDIDFETDMIEIPLSNFDKRYTFIEPTLIKKQYHSTGQGLQLGFVIVDDVWELSHDTEKDNWKDKELFALQYDGYGNLWIVQPYIRTTTDNRFISGDIEIENEETHVVTKYTVEWTKVYQITGEFMDMTMYNYYSMEEFYRYSVNACMMATLFEFQLCYFGIQDGCVYSPHMQLYGEPCDPIPQDVEEISKYNSLSEYVSDNIFSNGVLEEDCYYVLKTKSTESPPMYHIIPYRMSDMWNYSDFSRQNVPYPRNHKAIVKTGRHLAGRLEFQEGSFDGVDYWTNALTQHHQPAVFMFSPDASSYPDYEVYTHGITQRKKDRPFLFTDFDEYGYYHEEKSIYTVQNGDVTLRYDVLKYNGDHIEQPEEQQIIDDYEELAWQAYMEATPPLEDETDEEYLERLTLGWTKLIRQKWLIKVAGDKGKDYLYSPSINNELNAVRLLRSQGDIVGRNFDNKNHTYDPVGEQPTGLSIPLTTLVYQKQYHFDTSPNNVVETDLQFFFKIPDDIEDLQGYRLKDEDGRDISKYCILLYQNKLYVLKDDDPDDIKWIPLQRRKTN